MTKSVLGKGLGALIPENDEPESNSIDNNIVKLIDIEKIKPNMYQPRQNFDESNLNDLADSIKSKGIINPITVREESDDNYQLIAGERRWRAAQIAQLDKIPAIIHKVDNKDMLELAIIENIQRDNLNPLDEAESYNKLLTEFELTHQQISEQVGKSRTVISNMLRLLKLPYEIKQSLRNNEISMGHARTLLSSENENIMLKVYKTIIKEGISVRETEQLIKKMSNKDSKKANESAVSEKDKPAHIVSVEETLGERLGTKVTVKDNNNKGKIIIEYYNLNDFERIMDKIK
jgi:ParB family chromosome partitioning protein